MVFLRSVHSGPESIRSSFCGPNHLEDGTFAMSVDEPIGGPVVIRVAGDIDKSTVAVFAECVTEAIVCGRSLVVDLLDVEYVDATGTSVLTAAAARLASHRCRAIIACTEGLREHLESSWGRCGVECHNSVASAIHAAMRPREQPIATTSDDAAVTA